MLGKIILVWTKCWSSTSIHILSGIARKLYGNTSDFFFNWCYSSLRFVQTGNVEILCVTTLEKAEKSSFVPRWGTDVAMWANPEAVTAWLWPQCPLCHRFCLHTPSSSHQLGVWPGPLSLCWLWAFPPEFLHQTAGSWVHVKLLNSNPNLLNTVMPLSWRQLAGIWCNVFETSFLSQCFCTFGEKPLEQQVWDSSWCSCSPPG